MAVEVYGIRHHGPGSARAVRRALEAFKPDAILIEGPPEADALVGLAADPGMVPPVALLAYAPGKPEGADRQAAFWPFAEFSPEWQAIRHALATGVLVRFCDLPAAHQLVPTEGPPPDDAQTDPPAETLGVAPDNTSVNAPSPSPNGTPTNAPHTTSGNATSSTPDSSPDEASATTPSTAPVVSTPDQTASDIPSTNPGDAATTPGSATSSTPGATTENAPSAIPDDAATTTSSNTTGSAPSAATSDATGTSPGDTATTPSTTTGSGPDKTAATPGATTGSSPDDTATTPGTTTGSGPDKTAATPGTATGSSPDDTATTPGATTGSGPGDATGRTPDAAVGGALGAAAPRAGTGDMTGTNTGDKPETAAPGASGATGATAGGDGSGSVGSAGQGSADGDVSGEVAPGDGAVAPEEGDAEGGSAELTEEQRIRLDPLGWLARVAGYDDAERWWDDVVEHRDGGPSPFPAIAEAMTELREQVAALPEEAAAGLPSGYLRREAQREAHMRRTLRRTLKEGYERVAVVCGAWHVPALLEKVPSSKDDQTLRGLPKAKIAMTWVPWTHGRLANRSGYGAGVRSPGWYHHLFSASDRPIERWLIDAARVLREEDLHVSSAHVIEAVRLAETLAALRGRPLAGLDEVTEATRAVLCEGADLPVELIQRRMVVGERLGAVPERTPMVPLQRDLQAEQRRLRLKPAALDKEQDLDLRKPTDLERSRLLHRLRLLNVDWGVPAEGVGRTSKGTFRETWTLMWRPEFDVELIEASAWGTTVHGAATARAKAMAAQSDGLAELTSVAERCLLADLGGALPTVMRTLADRAAVDTDVAHLMSALPSLVRALRYGDVRGTGTGPLQSVVDTLVIRICVGLPPAVAGLDDGAARELLGHVDAVHGGLALLASDVHLDRWRRTLRALVDRRDLHGLLEGRLTRLLQDAGLLHDVPDRMARAVSVGTPPDRAAAWIEGFLSGGGLILVHDEELLRLVDGWVTGLTGDSFTDVLPLLRRTFGAYATAERRAIGDRVRRLGVPRPSRHGQDDNDEDIDTERAAPAVATALTILGWEDHA